MSSATINTMIAAPDEPVEVAQEAVDWICGQAWHVSIDIWKMEMTTVATVAIWAVIAVPQLWPTRTMDSWCPLPTDPHYSRLHSLAAGNGCGERNVTSPDGF